MATEGPLSPDVGADDASIGTLTWANTSNIVASDDARSIVNVTAGGVTHYLVATDFDFTTIPDDATVNGITVEWERHAAATSAIEDEAVRIVKGGVIGSTDRSAAGQWPSSDTYASYGGAADLWGETWLGTDIKATTFGAALACTNISGTSRQARVDHCRITVTYTVAAGIVGPLLSGRLVGQGILQGRLVR